MLYSFPFPYPADASVCFSAIRDLPWAAWLDSGGSGRYDILVAQPVATLVTQGERTEISDAAGVRQSTADPFATLRELLGAPVQPMPDIPFAGGALGYWGYDLARRYHRLPASASDAEHLPEMAVGIYDWAIILDHQERSARLVSRQRCAATAQVLPQIAERLSRGSSTRQATSFSVQGAIVSNFTPAAYARAFDAVQAYLHAGDCYQVNLAQRYAAAASGDAYTAYLELRRLSPAPYSAFLDWPQLQILCASPERFLQVRQGRVETRPIKGTRPRHADATEDRRLAEELRQHPKDRAENLMIVDLLRNDLGQVCEPGSVRAPRLFEVESFASVHHLVSTVEGQLQRGHDALDLLRDCFPGGSITGAPKQRAMEIIEQLEPNRRGVYCGAIGYIGHDGDMDTNIAIRTLVHAGGEIRCWAGGGLVADSQCEAEYQETLDKAAAMLELLQRFGGKLDGVAP
ncbi:aminodeoxychorismate synthase component 1 [Sideroxyarcus emersonii]|uniref:aminodeoxychorismate synthase n=1 Tax=Sideroxyarcus emersonii TaxID=2764705 RepID=A0AAN2BXY9_9PROT|nr:aminodeoxychorismate synthase component I [Sideroxyarcus emersonii]BCK86528.1 aminodeoxychorismate synthase component 1 [Sideroxyarcus emersonii]